MSQGWLSSSVIKLKPLFLCRNLWIISVKHDIHIIKVNWIMGIIWIINCRGLKKWLEILLITNMFSIIIHNYVITLMCPYYKLGNLHYLSITYPKILVLMNLNSYRICLIFYHPFSIIGYPQNKNNWPATSNVGV